MLAASLLAALLLGKKRVHLGGFGRGDGVGTHVRLDHDGLARLRVTLLARQGRHRVVNFVVVGEVFPREVLAESLGAREDLSERGRVLILVRGERFDVGQGLPPPC